MNNVAPERACAHGAGAPSPWIVRWAHLIPAAGKVLDVACGAGRHTRFLHGLGHRLTALDRDPAAIAAVASMAEAIEADIEGGPWPLAGRDFDGVIVTNYLWRPRLPDIVAAVAPGGVLLYETFAQGNESVGRPARPDFLLAPGELLAAVAGLRVVAYEDGFLTGPERFVQRITAVRPAAAPTGTPPRYPLGPVSAPQ
ncbi:Methyltransferase domain protein [Xylophilus ampelinus]|nr:class I SAM-dependent methyltransferase [Variovorax sp.]VTY37378.1 Methyltransferase domain protein [Xylophilus ampelinus]